MAPMDPPCCGVRVFYDIMFTRRSRATASHATSHAAFTILFVTFFTKNHPKNTSINSATVRRFFHKSETLTLVLY